MLYLTLIGHAQCVPQKEISEYTVCILYVTDLIFWCPLHYWEIVFFKISFKKKLPLFVFLSLTESLINKKTLAVFHDTAVYDKSFCCNTFHFSLKSAFVLIILKKGSEMLSTLYCHRIEMLCYQFILITAWYPLMWREPKECAIFSPTPTVQRHRKESSFDCSEKYWLSALQWCQMFGFKRVKVERWACGQSLLPSSPGQINYALSVRGSNLDNLFSSFLIYSARE